MRLVPEASFINLYSLSVNRAVEKIGAFAPDEDFIDQYQMAQAGLSEMFSQPMSLVQERVRVVAEVFSEFEAF